MSDNSTSLIRNPGKADSPTVRGSEGAGTTVLSRTDSFWQIFNLSAARTVLLPSVGVKAGDQIRLDLRSLFTLTVQAANASQIAAMSSLGSGTWVALIDSPAASTDWLFAGGTSPAAMDDATATRLGVKSYVHGGSYVSGLAPTMTATGIVVRWGHFMPYQVQDGSWRLRFNFGSDVSSATTVSVSVVGVLTPSSLAEQSFCGVGLNGSVPAAQAWIGANSNVFIIRYSAASAQAFGSGDIALASKPTWAY